MRFAITLRRSFGMIPLTYLSKTLARSRHDRFYRETERCSTTPIWMTFNGWTEQTIYGVGSLAGLTIDGAWNIFGATYSGVFELPRNRTGPDRERGCDYHWQELAFPSLGESVPARARRSAPCSDQHRDQLIWRRQSRSSILNLRSVDFFWR